MKTRRFHQFALHRAGAVQAGQKVYHRPNVTLIGARGASRTLDVIIRVQAGRTVLWLALEIDIHPHGCPEQRQPEVNRPRLALVSAAA